MTTIGRVQNLWAMELVCPRTLKRGSDPQMLNEHASRRTRIEQDLDDGKPANGAQAQAQEKRRARRANYKQVKGEGRLAPEIDVLEGAGRPLGREPRDAYMLKRSLVIDAAGIQQVDDPSGFYLTGAKMKPGLKERKHFFTRPGSLADLDHDKDLCRCLMEGVVGQCLSLDLVLFC